MAKNESLRKGFTTRTFFHLQLIRVPFWETCMDNMHVFSTGMTVRLRFLKKIYDKVTHSTVYSAAVSSKLISLTKIVSKNNQLHLN